MKVQKRKLRNVSSWRDIFEKFSRSGGLEFCSSVHRDAFDFQCCQTRFHDMHAGLNKHTFALSLRLYAVHCIFLICHTTPIWIICAWNCYLSMASHYYLFACVQYVHMRARVVTRVNPRRTCRRQSLRSWLTWFTECRQWEVGVRGSEITQASGGKWFTISSGWILFYSSFKISLWLAAKSWRGWILSPASEALP